MIIYDLPDLWDPRARATVELAAQVVGTALMPYTGLDAAESFAAVMGEQHVRYNGAIKYWAYSTGNKVIFRRGFVLLPLLVHEWGHTFDRRAGLRPSQILEQTQMQAAKRLPLKAASLWPGFHPPGMEEYDINEAFASLFADNAMQMFSIGTAGRELAAWMDAHMPEWVAIARAG